MPETPALRPSSRPAGACWCCSYDAGSRRLSFDGRDFLLPPPPSRISLETKVPMPVPTPVPTTPLVTATKAAGNTRMHEGRDGYVRPPCVTRLV